MCVFCEIVRGEKPCHKIYEDDLTLAFLNIKPTCEGMTLVIPKTHYTNMFDCPPGLYDAVVRTTIKISKHYKSLGYDGVSILSNNGDTPIGTGQSVAHLHFQIFPRSSNAPFALINQTVNVKRDLDIEQKKFALK